MAKGGMRFTQEQFDAMQKTQQTKKTAQQMNSLGAGVWKSKGRLPKGHMNDTEKAYAEFLEQRKIAGEIVSYKFHPMRVRLADNTYYEVDFIVVKADMVLEIHEVKGGFTSDKGQLKIKLCAESLPYFGMFKATKQTKKAGGGFLIEDYSAY